MDKFLDLLQQSTIVQAVVTVILIGTVAFMYATAREVPDPLLQLTSLVLGFWFGQKTQQQLTQFIKARKG